MNFSISSKPFTGLRPSLVRKEVVRLLELPAVHVAFEWFQRHERQLAELQLELAAIPAPPFGEERRSERLRQEFVDLGLQEVQADSIGNVTGCWAGQDSARFLVLSAHLDTVFSDLNIDVRREGERLVGPGVADNAAGLVALLAIAAAMRVAGLRTRLSMMFLANVGEEGEGDLRGMRRFFEDPERLRQVSALVALDGAGTDTIVNEGLGSRRFEISITGPGGHSWSDFGLENPIVLLARVIDRLSQIELPANPRTSLNVGTISGGTSVNAIPAGATTRVDVRSPDPRNLALVEEQLHAALAGVIDSLPASSGIQAQVRIIGDRPAARLPEGSAVVEALRAVDAQLGIKAQLHCASTDANIPLSLGVPAVAIGAGGSGARAHTFQEWFNPHERDLALKRILLTALVLAGVSEE